MCGIIAHLGGKQAVDPLLHGLQKLEYRGYDSAGIAVNGEDGLAIEKTAGEVTELRSALSATDLPGTIGVGHTRWSTHGPPTDENAHPHTNGTDRVAVVHNGVIENHSRLRRRLVAAGHEFTSETDTEVLPHLITHYLDRGADPEAAFRQAIDDVEGSYAVAAIVEDCEAVFAARHGSPLVLGITDDGYFLASDVPAFLEYTDTVVYLEDGDHVTVRRDGYDVRNDEQSVERTHEQVDWDADETGKGQYDHFMLKEIHNQPSSLSNTIEGRVDGDTGQSLLEEFDPRSFEDVETVHFVGCGTSYHAAMFGATLLNRAGISARAIRASEYDQAAGTPSTETAFVAVTQSGETADTLGALRRANATGMRTLAVTNVVQSTAAREADTPLYIRAGPEIGVAATKTFTSQAATLTILAQHIATENAAAEPLDDVEALFSDLQSLPTLFRDTLATSDAERLARQYIDHEAYFFIGRGLDRSVAKEGALKFKEITYEHAEGFAAGELKHGPLALVTPRTPIVAICTGGAEKTVINAKEAGSRGAPTLAVAPEDHDINAFADARLTIPDVHPVCASLLANLQLQLFSYHSATQLGRAIDKPRNLAKSVTVE